MKKTLLIIMASILSFTSFSQKVLIEEDVDFSSIKDDKYLLYKISTTKPANVLKEIDSKYVVKNFNWNQLIVDKSKQIYLLGRMVNDTLRMRKPAVNESPNCIYFEARIKIDSLPIILLTGESVVSLEKFPNGRYATKEVKNLYDLMFSFYPKLIDDKNNPIELGTECKIITTHDLEHEEVVLTLAVELHEKQFNDITSGDVQINIRGFMVPQKVLIKKSDVGEKIQFGNTAFDILEFDKGVLHLRYPIQDTCFFDKYHFLGNIKTQKFKIKCKNVSLMYLQYKKYRNNPKLNIEDFAKYDSEPSVKKLLPSAIEDLRYNTIILHLGYDIDSLNMYSNDIKMPTTLTHQISVKKNGEDYAFETMTKKNNNLVDFKIYAKVRARIYEYFRTNVKYPMSAMNGGISGNVKFRFTVTDIGEITDLEIISSDDDSFSNELRSIIKSAPRFPNPIGTFHGTMQLVFNL